MTKKSLSLNLVLLLGLSLAATACGRDRTTRGPVGPIGPTGGSSLITAAEGGTVSVSDSETQLLVPANSLSADTEIVLSVESPAGYPAEDDLREVIAMSPAGTTLEIPATLSWKPSGAALTGSEELSLVRLVDGGWSTVEASVTVGSGGIATTSVTQLETYGLRVAERVVIGGSTGTVSGNVLHIYTEEPLPGITFRLFGMFENEVGSAVSDTSGAFSFTEVPVGSYFVLADVPAADNCFSDPTEMMVEVTEGGNATVFFGFVPGPCS